jgi:hypothetical protein
MSILQIFSKKMNRKPQKVGYRVKPIQDYCALPSSEDSQQDFSRKSGC